MLGSGGPLDPHDAQSGVKVYVDVYDQTFRPSGECAKVRHGFRSYGDTAFNLDSHVVAVAEKKFFHVLDCVGWVPHISFPKRTEATLCRSRCLRCLSGTLSSCGTKPAPPRTWAFGRQQWQSEVWGPTKELEGSR